MCSSDLDTLVELTLCNKQERKYYLENRFVFSQDDIAIVGFKVMKGGDKVPYTGITEKRLPSKFPDDYIEIKPGERVMLSALLNRYFDLMQGEEYLVTYQILNANPKTHQLDDIVYNNKKIQIGK